MEMIRPCWHLRRCELKRPKEIGCMQENYVVQGFTVLTSNMPWNYHMVCRNAVWSSGLRYNLCSEASAQVQVLKTIIVMSTFALLCSILYYHVIEVKLLMIDYGADDWKVAVSVDRLLKLGVECFICCICPFPGSAVFDIEARYYDSKEDESRSNTVPFDVFLSLPMFLRFYLIFRCLVLHSRQFKDIATRTIASLNQVNVDIYFVLKCYMGKRPLTVVLGFAVLFWLVISWSYTLCETYVPKSVSGFEPVTYLESAWLIIVTFLSIGYGDITPNSYCGRGLAVLTGATGIFCASALIATVANALQFTRAEKHVNSFMADSNIHRKQNNAAAYVLQETWLTYKYLRRHPDEAKLRLHQRKFLDSIAKFKQVKIQMRRLAEESDRLLDVSHVYRSFQARMQELSSAQHLEAQAIEAVCGRLESIESLLQKLVENKETDTAKND